jgi:hypothetical protein
VAGVLILTRDQSSLATSRLDLGLICWSYTLNSIADNLWFSRSTRYIPDRADGASDVPSSAASSIVTFAMV